MRHNATERAQGYLAAVRHALEQAMRGPVSVGLLPTLDRDTLRRLPLEARLALVQAFAAELNGCTRLGDLTDVLGDAARWILGCGHVSLALPEEENPARYYRLQVA
jgi:hypothetical protein